jgi:4-hydroxybenzoate polyprenyltransferase
MAMNRILDRRLDSLNPRPLARDLPSGKLTPAQAWGVAAVGLGLYLLACAALGPVCLKLSPVPALVLISYSLLKRFTPLCHFGIGLSLALGPLGAHVAVTGGTTAPPALLLLTLFTFCWISGSDILYAFQDLASDRETGVHSIPVSFGPTGARWIAAGVHLVALASAFGLWRLTGMGAVSGLALAVTGLALITMYRERLPLAFRFFPVSAIAGIAGALIPLLKDMK